jgi:hypothetical protein
MAATPSITVVPPLPPVLSGRDLARGSPRQSCGAPCWLGSLRNTAHSTTSGPSSWAWCHCPGLSGGLAGVTPAWSSRVVLVVLGGYGNAPAGRPRRRAHRGGARWPRRGQRSLRWTGRAACRFGPTLGVGRRLPRLGECVMFHRRCWCTRCGAARTEQDCSAHAGQVAWPWLEV